MFIDPAKLMLKYDNHMQQDHSCKEMLTFAGNRLYLILLLMMQLSHKILSGHLASGLSFSNDFVVD